MLREFYLDGNGVMLNLKYNSVIQPDIIYKYGRRVYILNSGHYQLIFHIDILDKMSIHIKQKSIPYPFDEKYRVVDVIISKNLLVFRKPEKIVKVNNLN
jgi:hypothetical protein